jgi:hypothetical protein
VTASKEITVFIVRFLLVLVGRQRLKLDQLELDPAGRTNKSAADPIASLKLD